MKKIVSIIVAVVFLSFTTVTAFTASDEEKNFLEEKENLIYLMNNYGYYFNNSLYGGLPVDGYCGTPFWKEDSLLKLSDVCTYIDNNIEQCTTIDEILSLEDLLFTTGENMCLDPDELEWLLDFMEKDYNSIGYYDEETTSELKKVYENAKVAYESGDDDLIYENYVLLRNEFNKLCSCNTVAGDLNFDGELTVDDVTLLQLYISEIIELNSSQLFLSNYYNYCNVDCVSMWQKVISEQNTNINFFVKKNIDLLFECVYFDLTASKYEMFQCDAEYTNYIYNSQHVFFAITKHPYLYKF